LDSLGEMPLPLTFATAKIRRMTKNANQTVFAHTKGSVPRRPPVCIFTPELLEQIRARGVKICFVNVARRFGNFLAGES